MSDRGEIGTADRWIASALRRTERVLTRFSDEVLAPSGLSAPQCGLPGTIAQVAPVTITRLAELMDMDRTTLTRNLDPLIKQHLVQSRKGEDQRRRLVLLTDEGHRVLRQAWPLWEEVQARTWRTLGRERCEAFLNELATVRTVVKSAVSRPRFGEERGQRVVLKRDTSS